MGRLTFGFLLAKEALGHLGEELLGRAGWVELRHHHTCGRWKFVRSEALGEELFEKSVRMPCTSEMGDVIQKCPRAQTR